MVTPAKGGRVEGKQFEEVLGGDSIDSALHAGVKHDPCAPNLERAHVSYAMGALLSRREQRLREIAPDEAERDEFSLGLSRCLDILDDEALQP